MKYPRTFHLPWSSGTSDDKILSSVDSFLGHELVLLEKIDGSNVCLEHDGCYARTHSGPPNHPSFNEFKALHTSIKHNIPINMQIFGEWVVAKHSIFYDKLPAYFLMFGVRIINTEPNINYWLGWNGVKETANKLGLYTVPELANITVKTEKELQRITESFMKQPSFYGPEREGVVVRLVYGFEDSAFASSVSKLVRKNHVQTDDHWRSKEIVRNKLALGT